MHSCNNILETFTCVSVRVTYYFKLCIWNRHGTMLANHNQKRKQMSIPTSSWDVPDTHLHPEADEGE